MAHLFLVINNAMKAKHKLAYCPYKRKYIQILNWLEDKGIIYSFKIVKNSLNFYYYKIKLKYCKNKPLGVLMVINKPSNYSYYKVKDYKKKLNLQKSGLCISTSQGLLEKPLILMHNHGGTSLFRISSLGRNIIT